MSHRIEIVFKIPDTRAEVLQENLKKLDFGSKIEKVHLIDVYTTSKDFSKEELKKIGSALSNPVTQKFSVDQAINPGDFDYAIEIGYLPGVTDNIGTTAKETTEDLLKTKFEKEQAIYSSQIIFIKGDLTKEEVEKIAYSKHNPLIQRSHVKTKEQFEKDKGMDLIVPEVHLKQPPKHLEIDLNIPDSELEKLGKEGVKDPDGTRRGPLALDIPSLHTIRDYFDKESRNPTDIELESLAQTWSEHCKHTIFASEMDEIKDGLYKGYIKKATNEIRAKKGKNDFCVSVFSDNSGGIIFDDEYIITDKAETHNSPSALDPFGGAITGIVGVNRDTIGFGKGAKPIINKYGYCFADPEDKKYLYKDAKKETRMLLPERIMEGVVAGVNTGGNCSGIPTPCGFIYFEDRYKGKPLVFVGTIGLIPKYINGKPSWEKKAKPGDLVVMIGGRVGQDGIHGATFSSEALSSGSPATAVQIGDPITQKKLSDAIVKEARDMGLYNSITDNGAGGLSCSVAEMAKECGGCHIELEKVPLKYSNLEPWKIWVSESQERMTLAVPKDKLDQFIDLMKRRGTEATVIGKFNDSGRCVVKYNGKKIMDIDMKFLHDGLPKKTLKTTYTKEKHEEPNIDCPKDLTTTLHEMISRLNICSYDFISYQYDYVVQGGIVIGPVQGKGKVNGEAFVMKPVLKSQKGVVMSQALYPKYSDIDTYHMAASAIDTAVRNAISVGGKLNHLALMDNFCWCSSNEKERLGQLKEAARACYDYATVYGTPFISGKDSMFNDFKGFDENGNPIKISVPPTLMISSISVIPNVEKCITFDSKIAGDLVYILGETKNELGASEYFTQLGEKSQGKAFIGNNIPQVNAVDAKSLYQTVEKAIEEELIASCKSVTLGGLGIALAKTALAGQLGMEIKLENIPTDIKRDDYLLFSETQSRFIVTIDPKNKKKFENLMKGQDFACIGKVIDSKSFEIKGLNGETIVKTYLEKLNKNYHKTLGGY